MPAATGLLRALSVVATGTAVASCSLSLDLDRLSAGDVECQQPPCEDPPYTGPGSVGSGIVIPYDQLPRREIVGGFVQDDALYVAVRVQATKSSYDQGAILSVDLATGHRELVSGFILDRAGLEHERGSGPRMGDLHSVRARTDGRWVVHLWNRLGFTGDRVSIDPASGARTSEPGVGMQCPVEPGVSFNFPVPDTSVLDRQGEVYVSVGGKPLKGLGQLTHDACPLFDLTPLAGPFWLATVQDWIGFADADSGTLGLFDTVASQISFIPGENSALGEVLGFAIGPSRAWLFRAPNVLEAVDTTSGQRIGYPIEGLAPPQDPPDLWVHPDGARVLVELDGRILIVDPEPGSSKVLSY
jgi:hypothetical protein